MYNHNKAQQSKNRVHIFWDILYIQNGFVDENYCISLHFSIKYVPVNPVDNRSTCVYINAWPWTGDKPESLPLTISLLTHICVTCHLKLGITLKNTQGSCGGVPWIIEPHRVPLASSCEWRKFIKICENTTILQHAIFIGIDWWLLLKRIWDPFFVITHIMVYIDVYRCITL